MLVAATLALLPLGVGLATGWALRDRTKRAYLAGVAGGGGGRRARPRWASPPAWVFAPAWTALYALIGGAAWLAFRAGATRTRAVRTALVAYLAQLVLNAAWSPVFFGLGKPCAAMAVLLGLDATVVATVWAFARVSAAAAWLLVPYAAWLAYATALNWFWVF